MAEEVGSAYVSLIPSARGFSKKVKDELTRAMKPVKDEQVTVPVKPEIDGVTGAMRSELEAQMRALTRRIALELPVGADTTGLKSRLEAQLAAVRAGLAMQVPTEPGDIDGYRLRLRSLIDDTRATQKVRLEVDKDQDLSASVGGRAAEAGSSVGRLFTSGFGSTLLNPLIGIPALILATITGPAAAAVTAGAVLAGGGLAAILVGAFALRADEDLRKATAGLGATINTTLAEAAAPLKGPFLEAIKIVGDAIKDMGPELKDFFKEIGPSIPKLAQGLGGFLKQLTETGALDKFATAIGPVLDQLAMALPDIGNAVAQFMISMSEVGPEGANFLGKTLRTIADVIRFVGDAIVWLVARLHDLNRIIRWVADHFNIIVAVLAPIPAVVAWVAGGIVALFQNAESAAKTFVGLWSEWWSKITDKVSSVIATVVALAKELPGKITGALGNLGTLLVDAGKNVVQGLITGIKSMLGKLGETASSMAQKVRNFLPFSPAKEGPLSGKGNPFHSGQVIGGDLAAGMESQLPKVASAADELAGMVGVGGFGNRGTSLRAAATTVLIDASGLPDALAEWLRYNTRVTSHDGTTDGAYAQV